MEAEQSNVAKGEKGSRAASSSEEVESGNSLRQRAMATIEDDDERLLARIGYKQVSQGQSLLNMC